MQPHTTPAQPAPATPQPTAPPATQPVSLVQNIPVHDPTAVPAPPGASHNEADMDKIMQDVGEAIKKEEAKPQPKRFSWLHRQPKPIVKTPQAATTAPATAPAAPAQQAPLPAPTTLAQPAVQPSPLPAQPKPPAKPGAPVAVILLAVLVAASLSAVAYYTYK